MPGTASHIVQQQVLEISLDKKEWASDIQNKISEIYHAKILPLLDEIFSAFSLSDERIRIDKLELDLGSLDVDNLEEDLLHKLKPQLEEILTKLIYKTRNNEGQKGVQIVTTSTTQKESSNGVSIEQGGVFYHYLKTGYFPWWANSNEKNLKELIEQFIHLDWYAPAQHKVFLQLIKDKTIRRRLIDMLDPVLLKQLLSQINPTISERIFAIQQDVIKCLDIIIDQKHFKNLFAFYSMDKLIKDYFRTGESVLAITKTSDYALELILNILKENEVSYSVEKQQFKKLELLQQSDFNFLSKDEFLTKIKDVQFPKKAKRFLPERVKSQLDETEKIEIFNAGLVLIWPYIQIFFRELGLLEDHYFKSEATQWNAIHLLHYLATGKETTEEQELILPKLMCNFPVDDFVMTHFELSEIEKEECHHLLETIIKNWPVLKKTSVKGLQQTFIQRDGMLSKAGGIWSIQIERVSLDILLDRLNWSISNIKLPWNDYLIQVKW